MATGPSDQGFDPGSLRILEELRDLRVEMREDRRRSDEERRRSDEDRKRSDEDRKRSDERFEQMRRESDERFEQGRRESQERSERQSRESKEHLEELSRESKEHVDRVMREFREDSIRRDAAMQKAWKELRTEVRTVGLSIVKALNRNTKLLVHISTHHGRLLERIDRKLGARDNGRPGRGNGRGA